MKRNMIKGIAVFAAIAAITATQTPLAQASHHGGYGGGYHHNGDHGYYDSQQYAPQSYAPIQIQQPVFDSTIYDIQVVLYEKGYYGSAIDGVYGEQTKAAFLKFQEDNGLTKASDTTVETIKADLETLNALGIYTLL